MKLGLAFPGLAFVVFLLAGCSDDAPAHGPFPKIPGPMLEIMPAQDQRTFAEEFKGREIFVYDYVGIAQCRVKVENTDADGKITTKEFGPIRFPSPAGRPPVTRGQIVVVPPSSGNRAFALILTAQEGGQRRIVQSAEKFRVSKNEVATHLIKAQEITTSGAAQELASVAFTPEDTTPYNDPKDRKGSPGPVSSKFVFIVEWVPDIEAKK